MTRSYTIIQKEITIHHPPHTLLAARKAELPSDVLLPYHIVEHPKAAGQTCRMRQQHQPPARAPITARSPAPPDPRTSDRAAEGFSQPWPVGKNGARLEHKHTLGRIGKTRMAAHLGTPGTSGGQAGRQAGRWPELHRVFSAPLVGLYKSVNISCTHQRLSMP